MDQVKQTVKYLQAGLDSFGLKSPIVVEQESDTEFNVLLTNLGVGLLIDTEGTIKRHIGGREVLKASWEVYGLSEYPDTREEPGGTDIIEQGTHAFICDAISGVFELVVKDHISNMLEAIGEAEQAAEGCPNCDGTGRPSCPLCEGTNQG
jgi:hypothetical protein